MKSIKVTILGRPFPLKVAEDEEENMYKICAFVDQRFKAYKSQLANQPESTIMSLAALSIAEELFEARSKSSSSDETEEQLMERVNSSLEKLISQIKE